MHMGVLLPDLRLKVLSLCLFWSDLLIHDFLPRIVFVLPLRYQARASRQVCLKGTVLGRMMCRLDELTLKSKAPGLVASSHLVSWVPCSKKA